MLLELILLKQCKIIIVVCIFEFCCIFFRLVSGSGDIKLTKDGNVLLHEMVCS